MSLERAMEYVPLLSAPVPASVLPLAGIVLPPSVVGGSSTSDEHPTRLIAKSAEASRLNRLLVIFTTVVVSVETDSTQGAIYAARDFIRAVALCAGTTTLTVCNLTLMPHVASRGSRLKTNKCLRVVRNVSMLKSPVAAGLGASVAVGNIFGDRRSEFRYYSVRQIIVLNGEQRRCLKHVLCSFHHC